MASHIDDIDILNSFGGKQNYFEFSKKYKGKCGPCDPPTGQAIHLPDAKDFFSDLGTASKKFGGSPPKVEGFDNFINTFNNNLYVQDGFAFMVDKLKEFDPSSLKKIDAEFDAPGIECTSCKFDLEFNPPSKPKYIEYKSYSFGSISGISLNQLKSYIGSSLEIGELKYVFNKRKIDLDGKSLTDVKKEMHSVFTNGSNALEIYNSNNRLFNGIEWDGIEVIDYNTFNAVLNSPNSWNSKIFDFVKLID